MCAAASFEAVSFLTHQTFKITQERNSQEHKEEQREGEKEVGEEYKEVKDTRVRVRVSTCSTHVCTFT